MDKAKQIQILQARINTLQKSKKHLSLTCYSGVCGAVWMARHNSGVPAVDAIELTNYISKMLWPKTYVDNWLARRTSISQYKKDHPDTWCGELQAYRLRWMDHMIDDFNRMIGEITHEMQNETNL